MDVRTYLEQQQVHPQLIRAVEEFRNQYPVEEKVKYRVSDPMMPFYGTEILEMGIAALLQKEKLHILLFFVAFFSFLSSFSPSVTY